MRKILLVLFTALIHFSLLAQKTGETYSFEFKNIDRLKAIETIEASTPYHFYFEKEWIESDKSLISGSYKNVTIIALLEGLFNNTSLNFYITKNKIILTQNNVIHEKLAANYFGAIKTENINKDSNDLTGKPVFYQQYDSINKSHTKNNNGVVFIGKETTITDTKYCTITGTIINTTTGKPESNIVIKVRNKNISTISDNDGNYSLKVPTGTNIIETRSLSHKKTVKTLVVYSNGELNINIAENSNQLDEVFIKGKGSKAVESVVSGVISIDIEAMKNMPLILGERDILKVATTLPGVKTTGEGSAGFNVRGGKDDQNLFLLDNAVLYNPQHFLGFFSSINPYTAKKATIYKGSIPADLGGRLSSVFDITTKNGNPETVTGEGAIGPITSNLSISVPLEKNKSSLLFGGRATYSDWVLKSLKNDDLANSQASFYDGILKYNNALNKNNFLESTLYYSHDKFSLSSDSIYSYSNRLASIKWDHSFNSKNKAAVVLTNSEYKFDIDFDTTAKNAFVSGYKLNETQLLLKFNYLYSDKHKFQYGLSSKLYNVYPGFLHPTNPNTTLKPIEIPQEKGLESALYFSDSYKINDKFSVDLGLRYSLYASLGETDQRVYAPNLPLNDATVIETKHYGNNQVATTYGTFEPRLAARYLLTEDLSIKAGYDKTSQYIHLLSSNVTQSPTDTWILSNLNIKPQTAQQASIGIFKNFDNNLYEVSLESYYKKSENILDYKVGAQLQLNENVETELLQGDGKAYGIEFLIKKQFGRLNGWLGYTYSRTFIKLDSQFNEEKVNNGNYFPANYDKPHDVSAILNYKFTKRYSLSSNFVYQTGRPITYPIGTYIYNNANYTLYSDRNAFRIPDYYRLDIGINIEGNHKIKKLAHSFWNISVYNVLGRANPYSIYFVTDGDGKVKAFKTSIFSIPVPSITYNFKF
jgi:hypothetical protein